MSESDRPWRKPHGSVHSSTLRRWRVAAQAAAKAAGFATACDLCKRPIKSEGRFGRVWLRTASQWRARLKRRTICHSCYLVLDSIIIEMETNGARDHLPPEDFSDKQDSPSTAE